MAHDIKSPGVSVQVIDQTAYAAVTQGTLAATVGFAEKGPINEPTLILSKEDFQNTFGNPIADNYYMGLFANKFLDLSTSYFTRIAKEADYEVVVGTVAPGFPLPSNGVFWVELDGFPSPNNGIYRVELSGTPTTLANLVTSVNTAFGTVTLADGSTKLDAYVTAAESGIYLSIRSDLYRNVTITIRLDRGSLNLVGSGVGKFGITDGTSSTDIGNYAYAFCRVPVGNTPASAASITGSGAIATAALNKLSAFNKINLLVDGNGTNPFKLYSDLNVVPATGAPATFPTFLAPAIPTLSYDWTGRNFSIALAGFYHFMGSNTTGQVNVTHAITMTGAGTGTITQLVSDLNTALAATVVGSGQNLREYIEFEVNGTKIQIKEGTGSRKNYGTQCSIAITDGSGLVTNLGYVSAGSMAGGNTTYTAAGVAAKISAQVAEVSATASAGIITIASVRLGLTSYIEIATASTPAEDVVPLIGFTDGDYDEGSSEVNANGVINFVAKDAGEFGDNVKIRTYSSVSPVNGETRYYVEVYYKTDSVEIWGPVDWTDDSASNFVKTVLEGSDYVRVDFGETVQYPNTDSGSVPTAACPNNADLGNPEYWQLAGGNNGIPTDGTEADALAVSALDEYVNKEQYEIDVLLAPGFTGSAVVSKLQSVAEARGDILALVDPPAFLEYTDAIDWHNGSYSGSVNLTSSKIVATWDWQRDYDDANAQYVDLPPSIYMAYALAYTQKNYELWEAPAGPERGRVNSISSYSKPTQAEREYLYNDTDPACINPIVQFPTEGIQIYGQKTCLRQTKSTNRINVVRLVNHIKRNVEKIGRKYIFKLNEASTWASVSREFNSFLGNILERGGLQAFTVIFDNTTNTADRIDAGIMYGKIFIQPTRVAERIFIDITIQRTGALAGEG